MIYKNFGDKKVSVSAIAQGTSGMGSYRRFNEDEVKNRIAILREGVDLGVNFIDTADLYGGGFAEEAVGRALEGIRDKVFLASKFNPRLPIAGSMKDALDASLKRLKTDFIDLYQIHWPNPTLAIGDIMRELSKFIDQGKIRYVGMSNFSLNDFIEAQSLFDKKIASNQMEYNLLNRSVEDDFLPYCERNNVVLLAYSPLNQGRIFCDDRQKSLLAELSKKYNKTLSQVLLRWLIAKAPVVVLTKTRRMANMKDNVAAADFHLEKKDERKIDELPLIKAVDVPIDSIRVSAVAGKLVYTTLEQALENRLDLLPSPVDMAKILKKEENIKPIRLRPTRDLSGRFLYDMDDYDLNDQIKKFWGWIIAYGDKTAIPAYIMNP
jgi:aryl-alcohol dehydrogenase-like predicted oxidoreductase